MYLSLKLILLLIFTFVTTKKLIKIDSQNKKLEYDFSEFGKLKKIISRNPMRITLFLKKHKRLFF